MKLQKLACCSYLWCSAPSKAWGLGLIAHILSTNPSFLSCFLCLKTEVVDAFLHFNFGLSLTLVQTTGLADFWTTSDDSHKDFSRTPVHFLPQKTLLLPARHSPESKSFLELYFLNSVFIPVSMKRLHIYRCWGAPTWQVSWPFSCCEILFVALRRTTLSLVTLHCFYFTI